VVLSKQYRVSQTEYRIRKIERGIKVLYRQGAESAEILEYGEERESLLDELENLTGRRYPLAPEWPV